MEGWGSTVTDWIFGPAIQCRVLIRGLDAAGKTTFLYRWDTFYNDAIHMIFFQAEDGYQCDNHPDNRVQR